MKKHHKFASQYAEDMKKNQKLGLKHQDASYLVSTLRSKVIELQNKNKLLNKLIKRQKNSNDAYHNIKDLKKAKKMLAKMSNENDDLKKRVKVMNQKMQRREDLAMRYQTKLYKDYDDDDDDDDDEDGSDDGDTYEELNFDFERMETEEVDTLFCSMKEKIASLMQENEEIDDKLQEKEADVLGYEAYANEWDAQNRLGVDRGRALFAKLRIENEQLQKRIDTVYSELELQKARANTWQNALQEETTDDAQFAVIEQLKQEVIQYQSQLSMRADSKNNKTQNAGVNAEINEQFGPGLFNNLQYLLMDSDLSNEDMMKLKIKDKFEQIYDVVLIKQKGDEQNDEKKTDVLKPIIDEQKIMIGTLKQINQQIDAHDERISRIIDMLKHIKNSRKIIKWKAISKESHHQKSKFDLVVSQLRSVNVPSARSNKSFQNAHLKPYHSTGTKQNVSRYRTDSTESLDSVFDLSFEDNLTKYKSKMQEANHREQQRSSVASRVSHLNRTQSPAQLFLPTYIESPRNTTTKKSSKSPESTLTKEDVGAIFDHYDSDKNGSMSVQELIEVFKQLGIDVNDKQKMHKILGKLDPDNDGIVSRDDFVQWWFSSENVIEFNSSIRNLLFLYSSDFAAHKSDELHAFANYFNRVFSVKDKVQDYIPIDTGDGGQDILSKLVDGVLFAKMINFAVPGTIDERVLHRRDLKNDSMKPKQIVENLNIVLSSCKAIGVDFGKYSLDDNDEDETTSSNISVEKFLNPSKYEDIATKILSELSRIHLSAKINLRETPVLIRLAQVDEDDDFIRSIKSTSWLKRWVNYHLKKSGIDRRMKNFGRDFRDGIVLTHLLDSITRRKKRKHERFDREASLQQPIYARPGFILKKLEEQFAIMVFIEPNDILSGNARLIRLLCSQIFLKFKGMRKITSQEKEHVSEMLANKQTPLSPSSNENDMDLKENEENVDGTVNIIKWMNEIFSAAALLDRRTTLVLNISNLNSDLRDGIALLHFISLLDNNVVDWNESVELNDSKSTLSRFLCLSNCHYIVSLVQKEPFIFEMDLDGESLYELNQEMIASICLSLISHHYKQVLGNLLTYRATEYDIMHWCNERLKKLQTARFCTFKERYIQSWKDDTMKSCLYYIDLLLMLSDGKDDSILDRSVVIHSRNKKLSDYSKEECLSNASYALSIARKFGGIFYISQNDLVNVNSHYTMLFTMCIMTLILNKESIKNHTNVNKPRAHKRKKSILKDYGLLKNENDLAELQSLAHSYASPNMMTPLPPSSSSPGETPTITEYNIFK